MIDDVLTVFISHGRSQVWKDVDKFIDKTLDFHTVELEAQVNRGKTIIEKLEDAVENCDFAVVIMTAEDEQADGSLRSRQNVIHEIGFLQGALGRENVLVLKERGVQEFTNISGIVYEEFTDNIKSTFERIRQELTDLEEQLMEEEENDENEEE